MKRLTIVVEESLLADMSALMPLIAKAREFKIEDVDGEFSPSVRNPRKHAKPVFRMPGLKTYELVMKHFSPEATFHKSLGEKWMTEIGFAAGSLSPATTLLARHGYILPLGGGRWQFKKPLEEGKVLPIKGREQQ